MYFLLQPQLAEAKETEIQEIDVSKSRIDKTSTDLAKSETEAVTRVCAMMNYL